MKIALFVHSIVSDWNNGHVHFLRGLGTALAGLGHEVRFCESRRNWSAENLFAEEGSAPFLEFSRTFPHLAVNFYEGGKKIAEDVERLTCGTDVVIVHEFNEPELVGAIGDVRRRCGAFRLLFHDTHHRALSVPYQISRLNLSQYDGVLAFGESLADIYRRRFGIKRVWTFHEAADTTLFHPRPEEHEWDVVWIGNWGDEERSAEIRNFLIGAARALPHLRFAVFGVRYPEIAVAELSEAGIHFGGAVANSLVPILFARAKMTLHLPRRYYREALPGIPTIRPFEAMACGTPLICLPWDDREGLFRKGEDYVVAADSTEMFRAMDLLASEPSERARLAASGLATIRGRHTCLHRAEQLLAICHQLG